MNILITGGAGFIGSSLIKPLLASGSTISVIDNLSTGSLTNIHRWLNSPNFHFIKKDILDPGPIQKVVDASDIVFHLAANPFVRLGVMDRSKDFDIVRGTYNLLEAMKNSDKCKRVFYTSSSAVYGEATSLPIPENYAPMMPISFYGASKLACEAMMASYYHLFGISSTIFRLANVIGPSNSHGVVHDFLNNLLRAPNQLEIQGNGGQKKSYLYIDDLIEALLRILAKSDEQGTEFNVYNIGSEDMITVSEIANIIIKELSLMDVRIHYNDTLDGRGWKGDVKEFLLDISKISSLGWTPKYDSANAVIKTVNEFLIQSGRSLVGSQ